MKSQPTEVLLDEVRYEVDSGVALITLDAPDRRNALTLEMTNQLVDICWKVNNERDVGAAVVTGAGGSFCAGADRQLLVEAGVDPAADESYERIGRIYESFLEVGRLEVPTIAAVDGAAVGAGVNLMLAADLRIVSREARIIAGFLRMGLHPGGGHFVLVGRNAGRETAAALAIFGAEVSGVRAVEAGLAWEAVEPGEVTRRALELARPLGLDPALSRAAVSSFRTEMGPPMATWASAVQAERSRQMWSMARKR